jgi:hypothetical protein
MDPRDHVQRDVPGDVGLPVRGLAGRLEGIEGVVDDLLHPVAHALGLAGGEGGEGEAPHAGVLGRVLVGEVVGVVGDPHGDAPRRVTPDAVGLAEALVAVDDAAVLVPGGEPGRLAVLHLHLDRALLLQLPVGLVHGEVAVVDDGVRDDRFGLRGHGTSPLLGDPTPWPGLHPRM